jgi:ATP-dependent Clp protease ATP-binding subunit ClpA
VSILKAEEKAIETQTGKVGVVELLWGAIWDEENAASKMLIDLGADREMLLRKVEERIVRGRPKPRPRLTETAKRVLELAADEMRLQRHEEISSGHLLIGLYRLGPYLKVGLFQRSDPNPARDVLDDYDVSLPRLRLALQRLMAGIDGPLPPHPVIPPIASPD